MTRPGRRCSTRSGLSCELASPRLPLVRNYHVLSLEGTPDPERVDELWVLAHRVARALAEQAHGDPECYSLLYNAERTRRRPWAHVHILLARSPEEKRWAMF